MSMDTSNTVPVPGTVIELLLRVPLSQHRRPTIFRPADVLALQPAAAPRRRKFIRINSSGTYFRP